MYGWLLAGILGLSAFGVGAVKDRTIDRLRADLGTQRDTIVELEGAAERAAVALADCQSVNDRNAESRRQANTQAAEAVARANADALRAEARVAEVNDFMREYRKNAGNECYRMGGDELPADFVKRVFSPATEADN